eukprot:scaffold20287_cov63-Phaeocystis_antarctica.AAC.2
MTARISSSVKPQAAPKRGTATTMRVYASCPMRSYTTFSKRSVRFLWKSSRALWSSAGQLGSSSGLGALVPGCVQPAEVAPDGLAGLARHMSARVVLDSPAAHAVLHAGRAGHRLPHGQRLFKGAAALAKLRVPRLAPKVPLHAQQARLIERRLPA